MELSQQCIIDEAQELEFKHSKLLAFLASEESSIVAPEEIDRMLRQSIIMEQYQNILQERILAFPKWAVSGECSTNTSAT